MKVKMVVTDLDHTLLRDDKTVSSYTVSVFERLRERRVLTAFATARYYKTVEQWLIPLIGFQPDAVISVSGVYAYVYVYRLGKANDGDADICDAPLGRLVLADEDEYKARVVSYDKRLTIELTNELIRALRNEGGCVTAGADDCRYCERSIDDTHKDFSVYFDFDKPLPVPAHYIDARGISSETAERIAALFPTVRVQGYADTELYTFQDKDARKELALAAVANNLEISPSDIVAFGDDSGDVEMLRLCGAGVAVSNAIDDAKTAADFICGGNNDDGVAKWIDENVL